jgi:hypothetical protein
MPSPNGPQLVRRRTRNSNGPRRQHPVPRSLTSRNGRQLERLRVTSSGRQVAQSSGLLLRLLMCRRRRLGGRMLQSSSGRLRRRPVRQLPRNPLRRRTSHSGRLRRRPAHQLLRNLRPLKSVCSGRQQALLQVKLLRLWLRDHLLARPRSRRPRRMHRRLPRWTRTL